MKYIYYQGRYMASKLTGAGAKALAYELVRDKHLDVEQISIVDEAGHIAIQAGLK